MAFKVLQDGERSWSAVVQQDVLPGYIVKACSVAAVASTSSWQDQLDVDKCDASTDAALVCGIAVGSVTSGNKVAVYSDGVYYMYAGGAIVVGAEVSASGGDPLSVVDATFLCTGSAAALEYTKPIGTALSSAASGEQVVVNLSV